MCSGCGCYGVKIGPCKSCTGQMFADTLLECQLRRCIPCGIVMCTEIFWGEGDSVLCCLLVGNPSRDLFPNPYNSFLFYAEKCSELLIRVPLQQKSIRGKLSHLQCRWLIEPIGGKWCFPWFANTLWFKRLRMYFISMWNDFLIKPRGSGRPTKNGKEKNQIAVFGFRFSLLPSTWEPGKHRRRRDVIWNVSVYYKYYVFKFPS